MGIFHGYTVFSWKVFAKKLINHLRAHSTYRRLSQTFVPVIVSPDAYIPYIRALRFGDLVHGNALGEYASQALKAGDAAQPKGCSACFVPVIAINKPDFLAGGVILL